jgi:glyoxylase-like metal-dependent hydrolase (beta-lactamase superfamily II)
MSYRPSSGRALAAVATTFLLATARASGDQAAPGHIEPSALRQISDGVFVIEDRDYVPAVPNIGLVVGARGALVIDPGIDEVEARKVLETVAQVAPGLRIYATSTHFHPEHAFGLAAFKGRATIIANSTQVQEMKRKGGAYVALFTRLGMGPLVRATHFIEPDVVYRESYRLDLGNKAVELSSGHAGHTLGDQIAFVPDSRAVFLGDLLETNSFPILPWYPEIGDTDVSPRRWMETLNWALTLGPEIVVPGHGPVAGPAAIKGLHDYMEAERSQLVKGCPTAKDVSSLRSLLTPQLLASHPHWNLTEWVPKSIEPFAKDFCPQLLGFPAGHVAGSKQES